MTEASRGRVTITLGRSGQVVKRSGPALNVDFSDSHPDAGSKRSVRDRLGGIVDSSLLHGSQLSNKRQRGDGRAENLNVNGMNDVHIGKHDLRFKIMQKNVHRRGQSDDERKYIDLREKLSRMGQPSLNSYETRQQLPNSRERLHDPRERLPDPRETNILSRIPSTRTAHDMPRVTASGSSLSPWTLDRLRQRSPDRVMDASRGQSPPRNIKEIQRRQVNQTYGDVRTVPYMGKDVLDTPRPVIGTEAFVTKPSLPTTSAKPIPPGPPILCPIPQTSCSIQKSSFSVVEQQTVEGLLQSLGLGKYAILFKAEEVDMTALKQMGENDLKEIGIPMGPRKKIRLALLPRSKRQL